MTRFHLRRRALLRGVLGGAGVAIGLPVLEAMCNPHGTALALGAPLPRWFGVFWWGNGVRLSQWVPKTSGTGAAWTLSPHLAPFAPVKSHLSVVTGTKLDLIGGEIEHSQGICNLLAGGERVGGEGPTATQPGATVDQIVAKAFGSTTPLKSLEVGVAKYNGKDQGTPNRYLSHNGPNNFNPPEYAPARVFDRLFGGGMTSVPGTASKTRGLRASVLDAVKADAQRLRAKVGISDRAKIEQHLENVRNLEMRIASLEADPGTTAAGACARPAPPGAPTDIQGISQAMNRLLAVAVACGQTRVFTNHFCGPRDDTVYTQAGSNKEYHSLTHNEGGDQPEVQKIVAFIMKQFADLLIALKDTPMAGGSVLDHGVVFGGTDCVEGRPHSGADYPLILAGRAGGRLKGDVHFRSTEKATNVIATALTALDLNVPFGVSARCKPTRSISELLA